LLDTYLSDEVVLALSPRFQSRFIDVNLHSTEDNSCERVSEDNSSFSSYHARPPLWPTRTLICLSWL